MVSDALDWLHRYALAVFFVLANVIIWLCMPPRLTGASHQGAVLVGRFDGLTLVTVRPRFACGRRKEDCAHHSQTVRPRRRL